jgi:hypothetical protein
MCIMNLPAKLRENTIVNEQIFVNLIRKKKETGRAVHAGILKSYDLTVLFYSDMLFIHLCELFRTAAPFRAKPFTNALIAVEHRNTTAH